MRPNILWICADQQRHDTIAALGHSHAVTPNLDRLVASGVAFERAYSQSPICTPSRATMLTGRYPAAHQVHRNGNDYFPPEEVLVTKLLADAGYTCGLVGKLHLSRAEGRIERRPDDGYSEFLWSHHPRPDWAEGNAYSDWLSQQSDKDPRELFAEVGDVRYGPGLPAELQQSHWCAVKAVDFIERHAGQAPWLLSVNFFDPHPPFVPPKRYLDNYEGRALNGDGRALPGPIAPTAKSPEVTSMLRSYVDHQGLDEAEMPADEIRKMREAYFATVEYLDSRIGMIMAALNKSGQRDNTIVIFTSDHGDMLGDHGLILKGSRLYDQLLHVPLVFSWPGVIEQGGRVPGLVELVDIAPTLLDFAGVEVPGTMQGASLCPLLAAGATNTGGPPGGGKPVVVSEYYDALDLPNGTHATAVFDGVLKTVVYHDIGRVEAYRLDEDPGEIDDLWPALEGTADGALALQRHLDAYARTTSAGIKRTGRY